MPKTDDKPLSPSDEPYIALKFEITEGGAHLIAFILGMFVGAGCYFIGLRL